MPIMQWPHYADHPLALICRSRPGSYMPVGDTRVTACRGRTMFTGARGAPTMTFHGRLERVVRQHIYLLGSRSRLLDLQPNTKTPSGLQR
jgi:hypothetical protein